MNKKSTIIVGIIIILLLLGSGFFVLYSGKKQASNLTPTVSEEQPIGKLSPLDIGLSLVLSSNNRKVKVIVENVSDIKSLEYEITYDADIPVSELAPGEKGGQVERGFNDEAKITSSQTRYESKEFDLGSCSRNVCRYDTGVDGVRLLMKVTKRDGKVYEVKDEISIR